MRRFRLCDPTTCRALAFLAVICCSLPAAPLTAQPLTDFHLQWVWTVSGSGIGVGGLEIVDLFGDGHAEILATSSASSEGGYWYTQQHDGSELRQTFSSLPREDGLVGVAAARESGVSRIVVVGRRTVSLYDGASKRELATFPTISNLNLAVAAGDLDGNGILDAVVCDDSNLYIYELLTGSVRIRYGFGCRDVAVGQTDGDPQLELALAGNPSGGFVLDGSSLDVEWADLRGFGEHVDLADFDGDGRDEVAAAPTYTAGLRILDPESGMQLFETQGVSVDALAGANLDAEPGAELVWIDSGSGSVHVLDGATAQELRQIPNPTDGATRVALGDTDQDGVLDIVWGSAAMTADGVHLFVARGDSLAITARSLDWGGHCGAAAVGDFLGDGSRELAGASRTSDYSGGGIGFVLDLSSGRLRRSAPQDFPGGGWTQAQGFAAAQIDSDAQLEYCLIGGEFLGCFDGASFAEQWRLQLPRTPLAVVASELDGDLAAEVVVATNGRFIHVFEGESGWQKWRSPELDVDYPGFDRITTLDLGNTYRAVIAGSSWCDGGLTTFAGDTGALSAGPWATSLRSLTVGPGPNPPQPLFLGRENGSVLLFDPLLGTEGSAIALFPRAVDAFAFADFDRDGTLDVAALLPQRLEIQDGETGQTMWTSPYLGALNDIKGPLLVGDFDSDSVPELLVGTYYGFALFEGPLFSVFTDGFESGDTSNW